jgi:hypothetical protein
MGMEDNVIGAPNQQVMECGQLDPIFADKNGILVKQTMRGCLQECLGCEAKSEYKISAMEWEMIQDDYKVVEGGMDKENILYALEQSSCCMRICWRDGRGFNMKVSEGGEEGGRPVLNYEKPCGFPLMLSIPTKDGSIDCPCCCLLPKLSTQSPSGAPLGSESAYICDQNLFVPKLRYSEGGQDIYIVKPETCCGGCCLACNCSGKGCIYIPFYFHDPGSMNVIGGEYRGERTPQIRKLWAGLKKECCSTADTFAVMFPDGIDSKRKAGLLGLTFLLDFTVFERQQDNS